MRAGNSVRGSIAAVAAQARKLQVALTRREIARFRLALAVALLAIAWLATTPRHVPIVEALNDKANHLLAFLVLGWLADFSFPERAFGAGKVLALLGYGLALEAVQHFLPHRDASLYDLAADALGLALYACAVPALRKLPWLRRRWDAPRREASR
jgi:VanZ family protein